jgi:LacI family transcriptional regulator
MASYDIGARQVLDACRELNIMVPEEIAVIGVDDDPIVCNLAFPSLTSVIPDAAGAGYRAAELLELMMSGGTPTSESHFLPPLGISTRQSTDIFAVEDPEIRRAAKLIREQACTGITVIDVLREVSLSRRVFESRFRKATGQTPHEAILSQRLKRVEQLLRESDLSLETIAARTGFEHPEYMSVAFRKHFQMPPGKYRSVLRSKK